jgi:hypothetical protein
MMTVETGFPGEWRRARMATAEGEHTKEGRGEGSERGKGMGRVDREISIDVANSSASSLTRLVSLPSRGR